MNIETPIVKRDWSSFVFEACLFDVDGTLIDTMTIYEEVISSELNRFGIEFSNADKRRIFSEILKNYLDKAPSKRFYLKLIYNVARQSSLTRLNSLKFTRNVVGQMREKAADVRIFPGVQEILDYLHSQRIKMGLVSMSSTKGIYSRLKPYKILQYFDVIIGRDQLNFQKPDPEGLLKAAKDIGIKPENCIIIGDLPIDIEAGKRANMRTIGILNLPIPEFLINSSPDLLITTFSELKIWLSQNLFNKSE